MLEKTLLLLSLLLVAWQGVTQLGLSGPLEDKTFSVPEGRLRVQYLYQFTFEPPIVSLKLSGEKDGIIEMSPKEGIIYLNGSLDWETRKVHKLQLEGLNANGDRVKGPYSITINVEDINDNPPTFDQPKYYGIVRQSSRPGKPFMQVTASDRDDPTTPHAQLRYSILQHFPNPYQEMLFQIDNITGAISTSLAGFQYLDPLKENNFLLIVSVNDMAGQSINSFVSNVDVNITVMENLWKSPPSVKIRENATEPHPICIPTCRVQWNDPGAKYEIMSKEKPPINLPFVVYPNGSICMTQPLDREEKDLYSFFVAAKDEEGDLLARPVTVEVVVEDINDNPPVCDKVLTKIEVQENEVVGNYIGTLRASDRDQKDTLNSRLKYRIVDQNPKAPHDNMFRIETDTGVIHLFSSALNKQSVSNYSLKVEVTDSAFQTLCNVQINVIDINDQIPIFEKSDYGSLTLPEDLPVGTVILAIQATDADEPFTGSSEIVYSITKGDPNNTFSITTIRKTNRGYVKINNVLDFETAPVYNLEISATNPEPLVAGIQYNSSSVAYLRIYVTDVDEAPVFIKNTFIIDKLENVTVGSLVTEATAIDPEGDQIRYKLRNNNRNWLRIDPLSGSVFTAAPLDRETEHTYVVQIVATEQTKASQSSTAQLILNLKDVNDNPPVLVKDSLFFCHPLQGSETAKIDVSDPDERSFIHAFTYTLMGGNTIQDNWDVAKPDGRHAYISPKHKDLEAKEYNIPIKINDKGRPPMEGTVNLKVNLCACTDQKICFHEVDRSDSWPTVGMAVGILVGVLLIIGVILGFVFLHLKRKKQYEMKASPANAVKPSELKTLT
ncbi:cadherin-17 [Hemicordylus capensis]|uniref:cadherin-17 n=1 Tax=Hemicordylus capensis TaxID=884348 RepID=UPI0023026EA2|nr:cadherin-17 [Hemicordylus capensis]